MTDPAQLPARRNPRPDPVARFKCAVEKLKTQPHCAICGRQYELTPDTLDRCSACTKDMMR